MKSFSKINKINEQRKTAQQLIYQLALQFTNESDNQINDVINRCLFLVGDFFEAEQIIIFEYNIEASVFNAKNIFPSSQQEELEKLKNLSIRTFLNPMIREHQELKPYAIADIEKIDNQSALYQMLSNRKVNKIDSYPIISNNQCIGSIVFENLKTNVISKISSLEIIKLLSQGIASLWMKANVYHKIQQLIKDQDNAKQLKNQFLANMSHEIRTPLSGIYNAIYLLGSTGISIEQKEFIELGQTSVDALSNIIEDLLDISKIETGRMEIYQDTFNLEDELVRMIKTLKGFADEKGIELILVYDYHLTHDVIGDIQKIRQILLNLVKNAIKFTDKGSVILKVNKINNQSQFAVEFNVIDTGIGINEIHLKHIYETFYQIDSSETKQQQGTGLGLAICYQLTELLKGELQIKSKINLGSTFSLTIPLGIGRSYDYTQVTNMNALLINQTLVSESVASMMRSMGIHVFDLKTVNHQKVELLIFDSIEQVEKAVNYQTQFGSDETLNILCSFENVDKVKNIDIAFDLPTSRQIFYQRIVNLKSKESKKEEKYNNLLNAYALIVDDNRLNRIALANILQKLGMKSKSVDSGKAAIDIVKKEKFDIILMDIQMPEMDGIEATRRIRSLGKTNHNLPILAVTANTFLKDYDTMKTSQITDVIFKPIKLESLSQVLRKYISPKNAIEIPSDLFIFDQLEFDMRFEGSQDIAKEVLITFQEEYSKDMINIKKAINQKDKEQIIHTAHYFKGSCSYLSAKRTVWLLDYMMNMAKNEKYDVITEIVYLLEKEVEELIHLIKEYQQ